MSSSRYAGYILNSRMRRAWPIAMFPTPVPPVHPDITFFLFLKKYESVSPPTLGSMLGSSGCPICMGMRSEGWRERASFALSRPQTCTPPSYELPIFALLHIIYLWGSSKPFCTPGHEQNYPVKIP